MNDNKNNISVGASNQAPSDFLKRFWDESWTYIKTVVDVVREPILILDKDLRIISANEPFYRTFQVEPKDTEKKIVYELGDGQWNIPDLKRLLEDILPKKTFFKGFEVAHDFPNIGKKVMILNARQIHVKECTDFQPIILLAIEDISDITVVAEKLADHTNRFEAKMIEKTGQMGFQILSLEKEISELRRRSWRHSSIL